MAGKCCGECGKPVSGTAPVVLNTPFGTLTIGDKAWTLDSVLFRWDVKQK